MSGNVLADFPLLASARHVVLECRGDGPDDTDPVALFLNESDAKDFADHHNLLFGPAWTFTVETAS